MAVITETIAMLRPCATNHQRHEPQPRMPASGREDMSAQTNYLRDTSILVGSLALTLFASLLPRVALRAQETRNITPSFELVF